MLQRFYLKFCNLKSKEILFYVYLIIWDLKYFICTVLIMPENDTKMTRQIILSLCLVTLTIYKTQQSFLKQRSKTYQHAVILRRHWGVWGLSVNSSGANLQTKYKSLNKVNEIIMKSTKNSQVKSTTAPSKNNDSLSFIFTISNWHGGCSEVNLKNTCFLGALQISNMIEEILLKHHIYCIHIYCQNCQKSTKKSKLLNFPKFAQTPNHCQKIPTKLLKSHNNSRVG